jgi:hypothetical protein
MDERTHSGQVVSSHCVSPTQGAGGGAGPKRAKTLTHESPELSPSLPPPSSTRSSPTQILYFPDGKSWLNSRVWLCQWVPKGRSAAFPCCVPVAAAHATAGAECTVIRVAERRDWDVVTIRNPGIQRIRYVFICSRDTARPRSPAAVGAFSMVDFVRRTCHKTTGVRESNASRGVAQLERRVPVAI